ncbi:MAG TPA: hypothetical protein VNI83_02770 [Vicinamibacterales bacterium]|nr:hypothetical protein [Vicinamibacterales bacterium]
MIRNRLTVTIITAAVLALLAAPSLSAQTASAEVRSTRMWHAGIDAVRVPAAAGAEKTPQRAQPVKPPRSRGARPAAVGFVAAGVSFPAPRRSFEALGFETRLVEIGAGGQVVNLWRGLFLEAAAARWSQRGRRVFIASDGTRFDLGIPLRVSVVSIDIGAGWRFARPSASGRARRIVPYAGGGAGFVLFSEASDFAAPGDDVDRRHAGYHAFGGVEVSVSRWLALAADARYRLVPGALGDEGVSAMFGETALGGAAVGVRLIVGPRW